MKQSRVTMADIAGKLGVSRITVSMALRDHHRISLERRREIKKLAREMGYVPDAFLSALAAHRQQQVSVSHHGVLAWINRWQDPKQLRRFKEFDLYWQGASEAAVKFGYRVDEIRWEPGCSPKRLEKILLARGIEGVLLPPHGGIGMDWEDFDWSRFCVVRFGLSVPSPNSNVVTADGYRATVMAMSKIHEYGYRRIGLSVNAEWDRRVGGELLSGYFYAQKLLALNPPLPPLLTALKNCSPEEWSRQSAAVALWLKEHRPDALLTSDIEMPRLLNELGYRIPQDLAVAGAPVADIPGLDAGVDHHPEAIGRTAVEMLLKQMNVGERGEPRFPSRILIESRWNDGNSLPPCNHVASRASAPSPAPATPKAELIGKRVTLKDIAERAGVSKNTVSLALRDSQRISLAMRAKIRGIASELGYVDDPILKRLAEYRRTGASGSFQSVIAWLNHWEHPEQLRSFHAFEQYWRGARLAARRLGYRLEEFLWPADCPAKRAEQWLQEHGVLGLLIPPHRPDVHWDDFDWGKFSLMRFGMTVSQVDANLVTADHQRAIVMAIRRIHDYGYRRIGLIYKAVHDRLMGGNYYGGVMWAYKLLGIADPMPPLDFDEDNPPADNLRALKAWMQAHQPDAILTTVPQIPSALRQLGYQIPRDVAVAGTSLPDIPLEAGIDQCPHAIGQIAAEMLIKQISLNERGEPADPCRILVQSRWRDGQSLPPRPTANCARR